MSYCFRFKVRLGARSRLDLEDDQSLVLRDHTVGSVTMTRSTGTSSSNGCEFAVTCRSFPTAEAAQEAGDATRDRLRTALAAAGLPMDFGERRPRSSFTQIALTEMEAVGGRRVMNDAYETLVFEEGHVDPLFAAIEGGNLSVTRRSESLADCYEEAQANDWRLTEKQTLAYDLYAASFEETNPDARLVLLTSALEALSHRESRSEEAKGFLQETLERLYSSSLSKEEKRALAQGIGQLRTESISSAGRRLAKSSDAEAGGRGEAVFKRAYQIRSRLVHADIKRPSRDEVGKAAAETEALTRSVLARSVRNPTL